MSDVPARCSRCGNQVRVSEFIAPESLKCPNCSGNLLLDKSTVVTTEPRLSLRREKPPDPDTTAAARPAPPMSKVKTIFRRRQRQAETRKTRKVRISDYAIGWAVFLTLTPVLCMLRYVDFLSAGDLNSFIFCGQIAFVVFYVVILVEAFSEEFFDGIVCIFLPPYTLYYLFFKSTSFSLRAIIMSLLASFGYDLSMTAYENTVIAFKYVAWLIDRGLLGD